MLIAEPRVLYLGSMIKGYVRQAVLPHELLQGQGLIYGFMVKGYHMGYCWAMGSTHVCVDGFGALERYTAC